MLVATYVPMKRNDGSKVSRREFDSLIGELIAIAGGCTISGPVRGIWAGAQGVYDEKNYRIDVACDAATVPAVRDWVIRVGRLLGQEAMYFEVRDDAVEIIPIP